MFTTPASLDWLWWGAGIALAAAGVVFFVFGLIGDRAKGRARCARCWYDLSARPIDAARAEIQCPECGWRARRARDVFRAKRRRTPFIVAVLFAALGLATFQVPRAQQGGVMSLVPTWVLLRWPNSPQMVADSLLRGGLVGDDFTAELSRRHLESALSSDQLDQLAARLERGLSKSDVLGASAHAAKMLEQLGAMPFSWSDCLDDSRGGATSSAFDVQDLARLLGGRIGVPIRIDQNELQRQGFVLSTPIRRENLTDGTALDALEDVVRELGKQGPFVLPAWTAERGAIVITTNAAWPRRYALIRNVTGSPGNSKFSSADEDRVAWWMVTISSLVSPDIWIMNGGIDGSMVALGRHILIEAPENVVARVERLVALLASKEPLAEPARLGALRRARQDIAAKRMEISFSPTTTIRDALAAVSTVAGIQVEFSPDTVALLDAAVPASAIEDQSRSLDALLDAVLAERGLRWVPWVKGSGETTDAGGSMKIRVIRAAASDEPGGEAAKARAGVGSFPAVYEFPSVTQSQWDWAVRGAWPHKPTEGPPPRPGRNDPVLSVESIVAEIESAYSPDSWQSHGGETGSTTIVSREPARVVIVADDVVHAAIHGVWMRARMIQPDLR